MSDEKQKGETPVDVVPCDECGSTGFVPNISGSGGNFGGPQVECYDCREARHVNALQAEVTRLTACVVHQQTMTDEYRDRFLRLTAQWEALKVWNYNHPNPMDSADVSQKMADLEAQR